MAYFDPSDGHDQLLVDPRVQDDAAGLVRWATRVEADIVEHFTKRSARLPRASSLADLGQVDPYTFSEGGYHYSVMLVGYRPDPEDASGYAAARADWTGFARAFRQSIADVVSHRLLAAMGRYDPAVQQSSVSGVGSLTVRTGYDPRWPPGWSARLQNYSLKAPLYAIG